jgi:hypothetical protein
MDVADQVTARTPMSDVLTQIQNLCEAVVFGQPWLALGGLGLVVGMVVVIRVLPGIRV